MHWLGQSSHVPDRSVVVKNPKNGYIPNRPALVYLPMSMFEVPEGNDAAWEKMNPLNTSNRPASAPEAPIIPTTTSLGSDILQPHPSGGRNGTERSLSLNRYRCQCQS